MDPQPEILGSQVPRLWTKPLRELTPETSYGFAVIDFARDVVGVPLDPWQEWLVIHAGELLRDGRPRFRKLLVIVARQNGKTFLLKLLALFWLYVEEWPMLLGLSTNLSYAKEAWQAAHDMAAAVDELEAESVRLYTDNNDPHWLLTGGRKYKIAASTRRSGRSLSIDRLIIDELREHHTWNTWNAAIPTMNARPYAQAFLISNQGDDKGVVLNSLRETALEDVEHGNVIDSELGLFEWSAPEGAEPDDPAGICAANPNVGLRLSLASIISDARRAMNSDDPVELAGFQTEILCQRVRALDAAVHPRKWEACHVPGEVATGDRSRVALFIDVSVDLLHASLVAAVVEPGDGEDEPDRVRVQVVTTWQGHDAPVAAQRDLPGWVRRVRPRAFGWMPGGPAASIAAGIKDRKDKTRPWPPPGVIVSEISGEVSAVCMGFAALVAGDLIRHADEPLLSKHVLGSAKQWTGTVWRFARRGEGHCDAAYAAAGAAHIALTMPAPLGRPRIVTSRRRRGDQGV